MIDELKSYPTYRNSGVAWLGSVPEHWQVRRNGQLFVQRNQTGFGELPILEVSLKSGVRVREFENSTRKQVMSDRDKYKRAVRGDLAYNMMRMWQGAVGVVPVDGLVSPAYVVARPLDGFNARYAESLFRTPAYMQEVDNYSRGIVKDRNRLYWEDFKQLRTPCPPTGEQAAIVCFLDHADRRIRRYIRAKQRLIKLLEEHKQAIIHHAVTRGLDPTVRLKPSGVDWLGDVPQHWGTPPLSAIAQNLQTGPFGSQLHSHDYITGGIPVVNPSHMHDGRVKPDPRVAVPQSKADALAQHKLSDGDIVLARRGELGRCALVTVNEQGWLCGTGSLRIRVRQEYYEPEYLVQILSSRGVRESLTLSSVGSTMDNLSAAIIARLRLPCPPRDEQLRILQHISTARLGLDRLMSRAREQTRLMREYRTRLVADVVTGKLDVRAAAASLPDRADEEPGDLAIAGEGNDAIDEDVDGDGAERGASGYDEEGIADD